MGPVTLLPPPVTEGAPEGPSVVHSTLRWCKACCRLNVSFFLGLYFYVEELSCGIYIFGEPVLFLHKLVIVRIYVDRLTDYLTPLIPRWQANINP